MNQVTKAVALEGMYQRYFPAVEPEHFHCCEACRDVMRTVPTSVAACATRCEAELCNDCFDASVFMIDRELEVRP